MFSVWGYWNWKIYFTAIRLFTDLDIGKVLLSNKVSFGDENYIGYL